MGGPSATTETAGEEGQQALKAERRRISRKNKGSTQSESLGIPSNHEIEREIPQCVHCHDETKGLWLMCESCYDQPHVFCTQCISVIVQEEIDNIDISDRISRIQCPGNVKGKRCKNWFAYEDIEFALSELTGKVSLQNKVTHQKEPDLKTDP